MKQVIYNVPKKVGSQWITLPLGANPFIDLIREEGRDVDVSTFHPIVPQSKILKGFIKPTQN